jgi:hypothetical protein
MQHDLVHKGRLFLLPVRIWRSNGPPIHPAVRIGSEMQKGPDPGSTNGKR